MRIHSIETRITGMLGDAETDSMPLEEAGRVAVQRVADDLIFRLNIVGPSIAWPPEVLAWVNEDHHAGRAWPWRSAVDVIDTGPSLRATLYFD